MDANPSVTGLTPRPLGEGEGLSALEKIESLMPAPEVGGASSLGSDVATPPVPTLVEKRQEVNAGLASPQSLPAVSLESPGAPVTKLPPADSATAEGEAFEEDVAIHTNGVPAQ